MGRRVNRCWQRVAVGVAASVPLVGLPSLLLRLSDVGSRSFCGPSARQVPSLQSQRRLRSGRAAGEDGVDFMSGPCPLDEETVRLHQAYHDRTIQWTIENTEWVQQKSYVTDETLTDKEEEQLRVWRASKARNHRWPHLAERDMHEVRFGPEPQRFSSAEDSEVLGDPGENIFVISLMRRPTKLRRVLHKLHEIGLTATIVDAIDGDGFTSQEEVASLGAKTLPGYVGHKNTLPCLTTGQLGCFMSHFQIWQHMVDNNIESALILEDDFDLQEDFQRRLGDMLEEARGEDWNLMYLGRSPTEPDKRMVSRHLREPGYTLWTVAYIFRLDAARALVEAQVQGRLAPLDHYFSIGMGKGLAGHWNENAMEWAQHIPQVLRGLAITPPLVMPYAGSMFLSDTAMFRNGTKFLDDLPWSGDSNMPLGGNGAYEQKWRKDRDIKTL
mmetsp:Transcript_38179/g.109587  ORF Transcript_38179/g.109587 Transcript_38179/m.109587 type:complete len:441 (-) Transcript_38179:40-1362(-)